MLDYTEGLQDPLVAVLTAAGTLAQMGAVDDCREFVRADRTVHRQSRRYFSARIIPAGKFIRQSKGSIPTTARRSIRFTPLRILAATGLGGRNFFGYLTAYVQGAGSLALSAISPGDVTSAPLGAWTLGAPASRDMEQFTNVLGRARLVSGGHQRRRLLVLAHQARARGPSPTPSR